MKDVISVDSNSKSEDKPTALDVVTGTSKGQEAVMKAVQQSIQDQNEMIKKAQDTSLDDKFYNHPVTLILGKIGKNVTIGDTYKDIMAWHKAEVAKLLQVIEDEVIKPNEPHIIVDTGVAIDKCDSYNSGDESDCNCPAGERNQFRNEQRQALKKIKDNVINGGASNG